MNVLDPTVLTGFLPGRYAWSAEDERVYLVTSAGAIPANGTRVLETLDDAQITSIGSDWFKLDGDDVAITRPANPIAVGDNAFEGQISGIFHGGPSGVFIGISIGTNFRPAVPTAPAGEVILNALTGTFSLAENSAQGTVAGSIAGKTSGSTLTLIDDAGGRVALSGSSVIAGPTGLDYETGTSHEFTVRETLTGATNTPRDTVLTLTVTDVDDTAPTITSANPTGSYAEGAAVSGTLTASESVTWTVTGTDAADVTLNASTGAWSLPTTDFETKASYSFTFTATDGAGNTATQAVIITITDVAEGGGTEATPIPATTYTFEDTTWRAYDASTGGSPKTIDWYIDAAGWPCIVADATTYIDTSNPSSGGASGMMKDPWFSSGGSQGFDTLIADAGTGMGAGIMTYDTALNIDPGNTGTRIQANSVGSYVKAKRWAGLTTASQWSVVDRFSVLTVLAAVPDAGFFAPAISDTDKVSPLNVSEIDTAVLGTGFTLASGMPTMTTANTNDYFKSSVQPYWGPPTGESRRRMVVVNTSLTSNGYSGGSDGFGVYWSEWFHAMLSGGSAGATADPTDFYKAIRFGLELVANAKRGFDNNGGAGQAAGRKQFVQLAGHVKPSLMPYALATRGAVTHQPFWVTEDFVGDARGGFNGIPSNHDLQRGTHYPEMVGRPDWFAEPVSGVYPHDSTASTRYDSNHDADYNMVAGLPSFIEFINISCLRNGPSGRDGLQALAQSDTTYDNTNDNAAFIGYWDLYRTLPMGASSATRPYSLITYHKRYADAYDALRTASAVPVWSGVPYAFSPSQNSEDYVAAATGGWSWSLDNGNDAVWPTLTITQVDNEYSLDGRSWTTDTNVGKTGSKTTGVPVGVKVYNRFVAHNALGRGIEPVNYARVIGGTERMTVTPSGTPSGTPVNVTAPSIVQLKYPDWGGPEYEAVSATKSVGDTVYAAKGWWINDVTGTWTFQWTKNGVNISGATSDSYTFVTGDDVAEIGLKVTIGGVTAAASNVINDAAWAPSGGGGGGTDVARVQFDGTDYARRTTLLTGAADSKSFTLVQDVEFTGGDGTNAILVDLSKGAATSSGAQRLRLIRSSANLLQIVVKSATGTNIVQRTSTEDVSTLLGRFRVLISCDAEAGALDTDPGLLHFYLNDLNAGGTQQPTNTLIPFGECTYTAIAATTNATAPANIIHGFTWFQPGVFFDFTQQANRDLFLPANIGATGAGPTGSTPLLFSTGNAAAWADGTAHKGTGGTLTLTGTLVDV